MMTQQAHKHDSDSFMSQIALTNLQEFRSPKNPLSSAKIRSYLSRSSFEPVFMMESTQNRRCDDALRSFQAMAMFSAILAHSSAKRMARLWHR